MKRLFVLLVYSVSAFLFGGCRSPIEKISPPGLLRKPARGVEVTIDGDGQFPAFLAGRWKADKGGWEFVFEPDGKISSAVVSLGRVTMKPGQVTTTAMKLGGKGVFEPGQWTVQYSQEHRKLLVEIAIDHFRVELGDNVVQGQTRDFFTGSVSQDGQIWWADHFSFPQYIADTKKHPNYKLAFDPNDNPKESLIFEKITGPK
jgi:hypothetical protein